MVTYRYALKFYAATIQGHPVFEGGIYYYLVSIFKTTQLVYALLECYITHPTEHHGLAN